MADAARDIPRMSATEYLQMEKQASCKHEFVNGIVYAMAGGSRQHNCIAGDVFGALLGKLTPPHRVFTSDMKVRIRTSPDEYYYYPDASVSCSDLDNDAYAIAQPSLIAEALSPTTEDADRGYKFDDYRKLPSLQEYVLVARESPSVEIYRRRTDWQVRLYDLAQDITFESVSITLPVAAFYRRVDADDHAREGNE